MSYTIEEYHGTFNLQYRWDTVKYIVVHYTGSGDSRAGSARNNCVYFSGGNRDASAHYFIDDADIYEYADPSVYSAWHCGDGHGAYGITNQNSIGIEVCMDGDIPYTDAEIDRLTWLVQKLMADFNVKPDHVIRHYDASRKMCPYYYVTHPEEWTKLHAQITGGVVSGSSESIDISESTDKLVVDGLWGPATTRALQAYFGTPQDGIVSSQYVEFRDANPGLCGGWEWREYPTGSTVIRAMQARLGVEKDGIMGPLTIAALQRHYGTTVDGELWENSPCIKAMQTALNEGRF